MVNVGPKDREVVRQGWTGSGTGKHVARPVNRDRPADTCKCVCFCVCVCPEWQLMAATQTTNLPSAE